MNESDLIEAIFVAADARDDGELAIAIDRAMTHAFGDGYQQCQEDLLEQSLRAMNESGQGEHMGLK